MIRINLLPVREARRKAGVQQQVFALVGVVALTVVGIVSLHTQTVAAIGSAKEEVARTQAQIDEFGPQLTKVEAYKKKRQEVQRKLDVIRNLEKSRSGPVHMLDELATRIPEKLWINVLEAKGPRISLKGMSLDQEIVAQFMSRLGQSEYFAQVDLQKTELKSVKGYKLHAFEVSAQIVSPESEEEEGEGKGKSKKGAKEKKTPAKKGGNKAAGVAGW